MSGGFASAEIISSTLHKVSLPSKSQTSSIKTKANLSITISTLTIVNILLIFIIGLKVIKKANFY